ncbi:MAG: outer-membrane lipoprotein carrier protein LolA [Terracidiphilus sp.]|jgi:outer membrane lipoprotein-sorting protein
MSKEIKLVLFSIALLLLPGSRAFAAPADDLTSVLHRLDLAATKFQSTSANFEFDTITTYPVPDTDVQKGVVYYDRKGSGYEMGMHINQINGQAVPKVIVVSGGTFKMYEKLTNQETISKKAEKYESYLILAFGASGKDLSDKWNIKYAGQETLGGVKAEKLELVAKDADVLKMFPKVTIWVDPDRGVCLKQVFDEGQGASRVSLYSNIEVNKSLPSDAFTFKTDSKTQIVNR